MPVQYTAALKLAPPSTKVNSPAGLGEVLQRPSGATAEHFLMELGKLPAHRQWPVRQQIRHVCQRLQQPMRRLEHHCGTDLGRQLAEQRPALAALARHKA